MRIKNIGSIFIKISDTYIDSYVFKHVFILTCQYVMFWYIERTNHARREDKRQNSYGNKGVPEEIYHT